MERVRRHDLSPRVELLPMIDVIFLLLTFFIYSMVVMMRPELLPVQLMPVSAGESTEPGRVQAVTVDRAGQLYLNREPIAMSALTQKLETWGARDEPPRLVLALEDRQGDNPDQRVDRAPIMMRLMERIRDAGIERFGWVGPKPGER